MIFRYAMSGGGGTIYVDRQRGPLLHYYREVFYQCSESWPQKSKNPVARSTWDAIDKAIQEGALHHLNADIVLPRIWRERISTIPSLCNLARDTWSELLFAVNKWEVHRANEITLFLTDIGERGRLGMRHLKINVTTRGEAHELQQVMWFKNLRTLIITIPHPVFVHAVNPPWRGLTHLIPPSRLEHLTYYEIGCAQQCDSCPPHADLARKELYAQWE